MLVIALLAAIDVLSGGALWFYWVALFWGLGLAMHGTRAFLPSPEAVSRSVARERRRRERALRRGRERERLRARALERRELQVEFERAVEQGVTALLRAASKHLDASGRGAPRRPETEFERYVSRQRGDAPAPAPEPRGEVRARVDVEDALERDELDEHDGERDARTPGGARRRRRA